MNKFIKFEEIWENKGIEHYGIYHEDCEKIICFCCGGELERDEVHILEDYEFHYLEDTLKQYF